MKHKFKLSVLKRINDIRHKEKLFELASKLHEVTSYEKEEKLHEEAAQSTYETTNTIDLNSNAISNASLYREHEKDRAFASKARKNNAIREADDIRNEISRIRSTLKVLGEREAESKKEYIKNLEKKREKNMGSAQLKKTGLWTIFIIGFFIQPLTIEGAQNYTSKMQELTKLEESLKAKEDKLKKWEKELQERERALQELIGKIDKKIHEKKSKDMKTIKNQTKMITKMKPSSAAELLAGMNEELALEVMKLLKPSQISGIFNKMQNKDVVRLTEILSGYRKPSSGGMELRKR